MSSSESASPSPSVSPSPGPFEPRDNLAFPAARPDGYDPDLVWDEGSAEWSDDADLITKDGSKYHTQFVCVGKSLIYYEEIS